MQPYRSSHHVGGHYIPTMHSRPQQAAAKPSKSSRKPSELEIVNESVRNKPSRSKHKQIDKSKKPKSGGNSSRKVKKQTRSHLVAPFPLLQLPRVELWCRNPQCTYNNKIQPPDASIPIAPNYGERMNHQSQRSSQPSKLSSITSISTPLASDSNTTDTTLTIKSSSSGSISQNELLQNSKKKYAEVHEFYPGGARGRAPPPPKQVTALNSGLPRTSTVKPGHRGPSIPAASSASSCVGCRNLPHHSLEEENSIDDGKMEHPYNTFWHLNNFNNNLNLQSTTLKRDASVHSYGGFTLNGHPGHTVAKKKSWQRFCSSHKIALVVSTFSLLVTIGLVITLLLMKKKGMMEAMR